MNERNIDSNLEIGLSGIKIISKLDYAISKIESYTGCPDAIRSALSNPSDQKQQISSFFAICPNIELISDFSSLAHDICKFKLLS